MIMCRMSIKTPHTVLDIEYVEIVMKNKQLGKSWDDIHVRI